MAMEKHVLSKSTFIRGVQCLKSLYLHQNRPFLRDRLPRERLLVFRRGHQVGDLAHRLFPGGVDMRPGHPSAYRKALQNTEDQIMSGQPVIYEAAFQYDGVLVFLDILVRSGERWKAYEVKSSGGISETYLMDAALQYYVIMGSGIALENISLIHINKEYILEGDIDPHGLFRIVEITDEALSRLEYVQQQIIREKEAIGLKSSPPITVGPHCREPYDCDFIGHCWKNVPLPASPPIEQQLDKKAIDIFRQMSPVFLKVLTMRQAIPQYQGTRPYQEIAYGYSLITDGQNRTAIFSSKDNPELALRESLKKELLDVTAILCLNGKWKAGELLGKETEIHELNELFIKGSEILDFNEGESLLEKIYRITGDLLPEEVYSSDAVCADHYLNSQDANNYEEDIRRYAETATLATKTLYEHILNISH